MSRRATVAALALSLSAAVGLVACGGGSNGGGGGSGAATPTEAAYIAPAAQAGENGWEVYPAATVVDASKAESLNPIADSPEAAVVKFLASRMRGDDEWEKAMVASPSDRAQRSLDEWEEWELRSFQLRGKKSTGADSYYVKTYFEIAVGDDSDEGEDEFEVVREGDGWRISGVPA